MEKFKINLMIILLGITSLVNAQVTGVKIVSNDVIAGFGSFFGSSISVENNTMIVGAFGAGTSHVFNYDGSNWIEEIKLIPTNGNQGDAFGNSVSLDNNYAIIGAVFDEDNGNESGSAYIFKKMGINWYEEAKLLPSDPDTLDRFGNSVVIDEDYAIVTSYGNDIDGVENAGSIYVFKRTGTNWTEEARLTPSDPDTNDYFGYSIDFQDSTIVVSSIYDDDFGFESGSVYIFEKIANAWVETGKINSIDCSTGDSFGVSVSLNGNQLAVGAYGNNDDGSNSGSAYIFENLNGSWLQTAKLTASDASAEDWFGGKLSLHNDFLLVSAYNDSVNGNPQQGSAYIFHKEGNQWVEKTKIFDQNNSQTKYGLVTEISDDFALIGAPFDFEYGFQSGAIFAYDLDDVVSVEENNSEMISEYRLGSNYPNPFNPTTTIEYSISENSFVTLEVFNVLGQKVKTLVSDTKEAGNHSVKWNGTNELNRQVSSGVYFFKLKTNNFTQTRKMLLIR